MLLRKLSNYYVKHEITRRTNLRKDQNYVIT